MKKCLLLILSATIFISWIIPEKRQSEDIKETQEAYYRVYQAYKNSNVGYLYGLSKIQYNSDGEPTIVESYEKGELTRIVKYDYSDVLTKRRHYYGDDLLDIKTKHEYNSGGFPQKLISHGSDRSFRLIYEKMYSKDRQQLVKDEDKESSSPSKQTNNSDEQCVVEERYDKGGKLLETFKNEYNCYGEHAVEERYDSNGEFLGLSKYAYNSSGENILEEIYDSNMICVSKIICCPFTDFIFYENEYTKFDGRGNWIECIRYSTDSWGLSLFFIVKRKITYRD